MNPLQLLNAATMLFPFISWYKHRKKNKNKLLHKIIAIHIPVSAIYHLVSAFKPSITLQFLDFSLIHFTSLVIGNSICKKKSSRLLDITTQLATLPFHIKSCIDVFYRKENIKTRFCAIIINALPMFLVNKKIAIRATACGLLCYKTYTHRYGHPVFHVILMELYNVCYEM